MDAHDLLVGHGLQAKRVGASQIVLFGKRQLLEIFLGLHIPKIDALEFAGVEVRTLFQRFELLFDERELFWSHVHNGLTLSQERMVLRGDFPSWQDIS